MKKIIAIIAAVAIALSMSVAVANGAQGANCTPQAAFTETINHPAVTHVVHTDAVEATPAQWWNFSPNKEQGPLDSEPAFPTDPRGTWQGPHSNGGPDQDTFGTFNSSHGESGKASWFHREAGTPGTPESNVTVIDKEATVELILHEAVKCDGKEPVVHTHTFLNPAPHVAKTPKPKHVVTPTVVHAGL